WQAEAHKAMQKPDGANDLKSARKHIDNITRMQGALAASTKFTYDMHVGAAALEDGSRNYEDILAAEMNATKAALMARDMEGVDVSAEESRAQVYADDAFRQFCEETIAIRKQLEGRQLPLHGEQRDVIKEGKID